ncbi:MAG: RNA polymerase sigma factor [Verrucomicrobiia bacterium]
MPPENSVQSQWYREYLQPHEPMLRGWLQNRFANRIDVDNIVQESLLRVLKAKEVNDIKSPKAFFFATARNLALDVVRRSKVVQFDSLTENELSNVLDDAESVPESIARNQELEILTKAIQSLPSKCRRIFTLRKVYCMSQPDIAEKLGISVNTVATQLKIGVKKCSAFMHEHSHR